MGGAVLQAPAELQSCLDACASCSEKTEVSRRNQLPCVMCRRLPFCSLREKDNKQCQSLLHSPLLSAQTGWGPSMHAPQRWAQCLPLQEFWAWSRGCEVGNWLPK